MTDVLPSAARPRATARAFYDADVLVIGAGPAGLSAALRVRWVKGYHALSSSVAVFDPGVPGGLLRWGGCVLTGPAWAFTGEELNARLRQDIDQLRIPVIRDRVIAVHRDGPGFRIDLESGGSWTGRAVILATGFRAIGEEGEHYLSGVRVTYKGYDYFPSLVEGVARDARGRGMLVVGHERTVQMTSILAAHGGGAGGLTFVLEALAPDEAPATAGGGTPLEPLRALGPVHFGRLAGIDTDPEGRIQGAHIETPDGRRLTLPCGSILLDYNAFELRPTLEIGGLLPALDARGFVQVDAYMRTSIDGIFAAGDVTGRYAATLVALGDGVTAGFSAYRHVFTGKFGEEPRLFAYRATDQMLPAEPRDLPVLPDDAVPIVVGDPVLVAGSGPVGAALEDRIDAGTLRARFGAAPVDEALHRLIERKEIAVHLDSSRVSAPLPASAATDSSLDPSDVPSTAPSSETEPP